MKNSIFRTAVAKAKGKSARGLAHSKTLARQPERHDGLAGFSLS